MWLDRRNIWTAIRALLFLGVTTFASERVWGQSTVFTFGPDVPIDQQQTVRDAITLGHQFFQTRLGTTVQGTTNVFVFADKDCRGPEANFGVIFLCASGTEWNTDRIGAGIRNQRIQTTLHEYVHVLQFDLAGPVNIGPIWLVEGTAEYLTFVHFDDEGILDLDGLIGGQRFISRSVSALRNLENLDGLRSEPNARALSMAAVDVLVLLNDFPALANFWRGIGTGATRQKAFESAFGRTIDEFYVEFEEIRNRNFEDLDLDGMDDEFENRFGLNPKDPDDAGLDNDRDGLTNLEEFQARTNPIVNEAAALQIINSILSD